MKISLSTHSGSHVDAPSHFIPDGRSIDDYRANELLFTKIETVKVNVAKGKLLRPSHFGHIIPNKDIDCVLIYTGFGKLRNSASYSKNGPGFCEETAKFLLTLWPNVKAIGVDFISFNSYRFIKEGCDAHRVFLEKEILLLEDLDLHELSTPARKPAAVLVSP